MNLYFSVIEDSDIVAMKYSIPTFTRALLSINQLQVSRVYSSCALLRPTKKNELRSFTTKRNFFWNFWNLFPTVKYCLIKLGHSSDFVTLGVVRKLLPD